MKRRSPIIAALFAMMITISPAFAQRIQVVDTALQFSHVQIASQSGNAVFTFPIRPGMTSHQYTFYVSPAVTAVSTAIDMSSNGLSWTSCGTSVALAATITCSTTTASAYTIGRVTLTGFTGSGFFDSDYYGVSSAANAGGGGGGSGGDVNIATQAGTATAVGNGTTNAGTPRITLSSDSTGTVIATQPTAGNFNAKVIGAGTAGTANANPVTVQGIAGMTPVAIAGSDGTAFTAVTDPCDGLAKTPSVFSISTATTTQLVAASSSNKIYICSIVIKVGAANNVALVEDDTAACASPTAGMSGGVTAATGWVFDAAGGATYGAGIGSVFQTAATNRYVCFITSAAVQTSGTLMYVLAP